MALAFLNSGGTIQSLSNPQTAAEKAFATFYTEIKHKTLRYALKHTAICRRTLQKDPNAPVDFTYKEKWKIPEDCVKFLGVGGIGEDWHNNYVLEGGYICVTGSRSTMDGLLDIRYIRDIPESEMPDDFALLLAHELAACMGIARRITDNNDTIALANQALIAYRREYKKNNTEEIRPAIINQSKVRAYSNWGQLPTKR